MANAKQSRLTAVSNVIFYLENWFFFILQTFNDFFNLTLFVVQSIKNHIVFYFVQIMYKNKNNMHIL